MGFHFSLASVLRVRESIEAREERALHAMQANVTRVGQVIESLRSVIASRRQVRDEALQHCLTGGHLQSLICEEQSTERDVGLLLAQLQMLEKQRDEQVVVYRSAHRDREMLTDMLEKQKVIYERERLRTEQKRLDDLFISRRLRA